MGTAAGPGRTLTGTGGHASAHIECMSISDNTMTAERQAQFHEQALKAERDYKLGDPIAVVRIYPEGNFLTGGTAGRDHDEISKTLLRVSLAELEIKDRRTAR